MSEIFLDVNKLIPALLEATRLGTVKWVPTDFKNRFKASVGSGVVEVYPDTVAVVDDPDDPFERDRPARVITLYNEYGRNIGNYYYTEDNRREYSELGQLLDEVDESVTKKKKTVQSMLDALRAAKGD